MCGFLFASCSELNNYCSVTKVVEKRTDRGQETQYETCTCAEVACSAVTTLLSFKSIGKSCVLNRTFTLATRIKTFARHSNAAPTSRDVLKHTKHYEMRHNHRYRIVTPQMSETIKLRSRKVQPPREVVACRMGR